MKKHNISQFFKSKSFYVVLFVAVIAIAGVTVVGLRISSKNSKNQNLVDLNTPLSLANNEEINIGEDSSNAVNTTDAASKDSNITDDKVSGDYTNDELLEFDVGSFITEESTQVANDSTKTEENIAQEKNEGSIENQAENQSVEDETTQKEETVSVMKPSVSENGLQFSSESSLSWPVKGNVILPFSMDSLVHYATLGEWKTSPAIIISSEAGSEVACAVKGVVSKVENNEETGTTVTMNIGGGYELVYGQLTEVSCETGTVIEQGTIIGKVAEPTKYYSIEGSNLYLQVLCNGEPVNPMLFLAAEE